VEWPRADLPEIALAGRSNAGKSSLLNALANRRALARVSRTPGRTRRLHFFDFRIGRTGLALVDLPGYGFAQASRTEQERWGAAVEEYVVDRPVLRGLVLIVDARRGPEEEERQLEALATERGIPAIRVATKVDKLGSGERVRRWRELERDGARWIAFSAKTREGRDELLREIARAAGARP
jgi:GTP-binding protein